MLCAVSSQGMRLCGQAVVAEILTPDIGQVNCSEGEYAVDDYWSWKGWRDGLAGVQALGTVGRRLG